MCHSTDTYEKKNFMFYPRNAGTNAVNIANNHIGDYGEEGVKGTTDILKHNDIQYFGVNYGESYSTQVKRLLYVYSMVVSFF